NENDDVTQPTVTDCTAMLGYINPDFFLGGDIPIDVDAAIDAVDEHIASPLDEDPYETARGVLDLVEEDMANELTAMIVGLGYSPESYNLVSYGGGGPLHAAGYTRNAAFEDVLIPEWAAAFSAFGAACADYSYRYDQSVELHVDPDLDNLDTVTDRLTEVMLDLRENVVEAFERDGIDVEEMTYQPSVRIQYTGMLDDLEIDVPMDFWEDGFTAEGLRKLIGRYDERFRQIFRRASSAPDMGYTITTVTGLGIAPSPMPTIPNVDTVDQRTPPEAASKGTRPIYWDDTWHDASIWDMDHVQAGNVLEGPSVAEAPSTTMLVPPGFEAELDENRIYHLRQHE
ncbi:MAG: hydantoinase/oxoprolinase family protein, partial [Haloarculaceae archaeon]